jgi:hypothetical protein
MAPGTSKPQPSISMNELTPTEMLAVTGGMSSDNLPPLASSAILMELLAEFARQQQQALLCALQHCYG